MAINRSAETQHRLNTVEAVNPHWQVYNLLQNVSSLRQTGKSYCYSDRVYNKSCYRKSATLNEARKRFEIVRKDSFL